MTDDLEELKRRLVVGQKRDGRCVYDEAAKSELVALCLKPGASVSRLARECGVNANQVGRWLREHGHGRRARTVAASVTPTQPAFVALPVMPTAAIAVASDAGEDNVDARMSAQARLPNGVAIELRGVDVRHIGEVIEALGEAAVFRFDEALTVYLHREAIDFRVGLNGLAILVEQALGLDPFAKAVYVFRNRRRDRVKILAWDRNGFWMLMKRLEQDRFIWPDAVSVPQLTVEDLHWLLDGIDLAVVRKHPERMYARVA